VPAVAVELVQLVEAAAHLTLAHAAPIQSNVAGLHVDVADPALPVVLLHGL